MGWRELGGPPAAPAACAAAVVLLGVRLLPDVRNKPLYEDEALAGLVSALPIGELLPTVLYDRGGAPLHFVLGHIALALEPSPTALRGLSVVFALATVPLCYDLARRLGGPVAGATAALLAASSQMLGIFGTFGRMYALFAFVAALAIDLFVRAVSLPTRRAVAIAAAAAWLLPATHPYGGVVVAAEAIVALALWRGRPLRGAVPVVVVLVAMLPFALANLRLAGRFAVGNDGSSVVDVDRSLRIVGRAVGGFAGGTEPVVLVFVALVVWGTVWLARRATPVVLFAALAGALPLAVLTFGRSTADLSAQVATRHLIFALPFWVAFAGVGTARLASLLPRSAAPVLVAAVTVAALLAPSAVVDPRTAASGERTGLAAPAQWFRERVDTGYVLFPNSPVFFAAVADASRARSLSREQPVLITRALRRVQLPVRAVIVAVPLDGTRLDPSALRDRLADDATVAAFRLWVLVELPGPFAEQVAILSATRRALGAIDASATVQSPRVSGFLRQGTASLCGAIRDLGGTCLPVGS